MLNIFTRTMNKMEQKLRNMDAYGIDLRVACPAVVRSVDYKRQTLTCQPAIRERMNDGKGNLSWIDIPELLDVPFFVYSGGGYCLTLPIQPGDDCLVIFGDSCMDAWWQSGGVQNQVERRRHDLSDGFALVGFRSQPAVVSGYSSGTAQLRNKAGTAYIEISGNDINIKASGNVNINGANIYLNS
ncbi:MAG: Gp138 family membrane-puncturing spike protein [Selenomonadaceae bacterium]